MIPADRSAFCSFMAARLGCGVRFGVRPSRQSHPSARQVIRGRCVLAFLLSGAFLVGCDRGSSDRSRAGDRGSSVPVVSKPSPWLIDGSREALLLVDSDPDAALHKALEAASRQARETAAEARELWRQARPDERERWLIKWAAPVLDELGQPTGRVEHVWVRPLAWSPFRIEGVLASIPRGRIGHEAGDLVAFPIEELSDWVFKIEDRIDGPRRGGFTVEVLEKHAGAPDSSNRERGASSPGPQ